MPYYKSKDGAVFLSTSAEGDKHAARFKFDRSEAPKLSKEAHKYTTAVAPGLLRYHPQDVLESLFVRSPLILVEAQENRVALNLPELKKIFKHHGFDYRWAKGHHMFKHAKTGGTVTAGDDALYGPAIMAKMSRFAARAMKDSDIAHRDNWDPDKLDFSKPGSKVHTKPGNAPETSKKVVPTSPKRMPITSAERTRAAGEHAAQTQAGDIFKERAKGLTGKEHFAALRQERRRRRRASKLIGKMKRVATQ